jgi:hypothetical protein
VVVRHRYESKRSSFIKPCALRQRGLKSGIWPSNSQRRFIRNRLSPWKEMIFGISSLFLFLARKRGTLLGFQVDTCGRGISTPSVSESVARGKRIAGEKGRHLLETIKPNSVPNRCFLTGNGGLPDLDYSTQLKVLSTAFCQPRYPFSLSASAVAGLQVLSARQFSCSSSNPDQKPTASPAA